MANLEEIPQDILILVAKRLPIDDFIAFSRVCTSFRAITTEENCSKEIAVPWLMFSEKKPTRSCKFFSLAVNSNDVHRLHLPEVGATRCLSSLGWIMTVRRGWCGWKMNLVNPFTGHNIKFPRLKMFRDYTDIDEYHLRAYSVPRFVLSNDPSRARDYMVAILYGERNKMGFWKSGDGTWTTVETDGANSDLIFYRQQLTSITASKIMVYDIHGPNPIRARAVFDLPVEIIWADQLYLVESAGSLLVVSQHGHPINGIRMTHFKVFEVDLDSKEWNRVESLKNRSLFLGFNSSFSVAADISPGSVEPNCIYFTDDYLCCKDSKETRGKDIGKYSMVDGSVQTLFCSKFHNLYSPPLWIQPRF